MSATHTDTIREALREFLADVDDARKGDPDSWDEAVRIGARFANHERRLRTVVAALDALEAALLAAGVVIERMANGASRQECSPEMERFLEAWRPLVAAERVGRSVLPQPATPSEPLPDEFGHGLIPQPTRREMGVDAPDFGTILGAQPATPEGSHAEAGE